MLALVTCHISPPQSDTEKINSWHLTSRLTARSLSELDRECILGKVFFFLSGGGRVRVRVRGFDAVIVRQGRGGGSSNCSGASSKVGSSNCFFWRGGGGVRACRPFEFEGSESLSSFSRGGGGASSSSSSTFGGRQVRIFFELLWRGGRTRGRV